MREEGEILALLPQAVAGDTDIGDSVEPGEAAEQRRCGRTKRRPDRAATRGVETAEDGRLPGDRRWNAKAGGGLADHLARLEQARLSAEAQNVCLRTEARRGEKNGGNPSYIRRGR